jgi:cytochrome c553
MHCSRFVAGIGVAILAAAAGTALIAGPALAQKSATEPGLPAWAYPVSTHKWPKPDPNQKARLPGSKKVFTLAQVNNGFAPPDWYPGDHPPMPGIVGHGRKPDVMACGYCHLPNGHGRPENATLAGLPADYIMEQVRDMRTGRRQSSTHKMGSINAMMKIAKASNDAEVRAAADYFSKLKMTKWIRVVETDMVPPTEINGHNMLQVARGKKEPIGKRILEVPENLERTELRDFRSGFVAYVPRGSIARGRKLVESGAGAFPCAACHGPGLRGNGQIPARAGHSPSYIMRQLTDFKRGTRRGAGADMMRPEVANLNDDMRLDISAYIASLNP